MAKSKKAAATKSREIPKTPAAIKAIEQAPAKSHAFRETVESIVIAFVLAFLFRVFEAEAFVIPTGSMAPTLMGRHKDVDCPKCGHRYQVSASEENTPDDPNIQPSDCIAGMCPICHYVMPMVRPSRLPAAAPEAALAEATDEPSYNGDRILVNKYVYTFSEPKRWDVVVFKFPGDAKVNYIKRLVGLPGEKLRVYQGDLFVGDQKAAQPDDFTIERKPADKVLAMRQLVHDTEHDPAELDAAGWPLRWQSSIGGEANAWQVEKSVEGTNVQQKYSVDAKGENVAWLRYNHFVPNYGVWQYVLNSEPGAKLPEHLQPQHRLITDANPYNGREDRRRVEYGNRWVVDRNSLEIDRTRQGLHWVGDLLVEADVNVEEARGSLLLDLVEGGRHFTCTIDLKTGEATLAAGADESYKPTAKTSVTGPGDYHVAFANFDDQLYLWVDDDLISFESGTSYDAERVFGDRRGIKPATSDEDLGDFAPAGIGARDAKVSVSRLQMWRDIYYIADDAQRHSPSDPVSDFTRPLDDFVARLPIDPKVWNRFKERNDAIFPLSEDQFFVMGDNSAESSDARLWSAGMGHGGRRGGPGPYLERRLLIGKALAVYWPHSWNRIPGTPIPFPLFPNFGDMRLVR